MTARSRSGTERIVGAWLAGSGLILRGGFDFDAGEAAPTVSAGIRARSVLLVGNAGSGYWQHFAAWRAALPNPVEHPLDRWSREVIGDIARRVGGHLVMPNDRPFQPFQQWAMRAEGLRPSPLGILIHPVYGLWHAYRGAIAFEEPLGAAAGAGPLQKQIHPCDPCDGKPCLSACPAGAVDGRSFDHRSCLGHLRSGEGGACMSGGCLARNACPQGLAYRYHPEAQAFHQAAFAG